MTAEAPRPDDGHAPGRVALETTLLAHGVPPGEGLALGRDLERIVRDAGGVPATVGVLHGRPLAGMSERELEELLAEAASPAGLAKLNTSNLGLALHRGRSGATTVSATMEIAAAAGIRLFATGGLGGVHRGYGRRLDISSDLAALARFPVAVVCSGVKSILDVESTREALETLGVPVVGFRCERFPAFYVRESGVGVDASFEDEASLAAYLDFELPRTGRGVVVAQPCPAEEAFAEDEWLALLGEAGLGGAEAAPGAPAGRGATPEALARLHRLSGGRTLRANLALVRANAALAGRLGGEFSRFRAR